MDTVLSAANSILAVIVVIGLCLSFHELGHFLAAKASRMLVHDFAMGFGPAIWRRKWGDTLYAIRIIPFGGFVRIAGMEPGEGDVPGGFHSRPRWQAQIVLCAGTFMNLVLAVLLYWGIAVFSGVQVEGSTAVVVRDVFPKSAAEAAGVQPGDRLVGVAGGDRSTELLDVVKGSVAEKMGLTRGSRIFQIGNQPVATPADVARLLHAGVAKGAKVWVINGEAKGIEDAILGLKPPSPTVFAFWEDKLQGAQSDAAATRALGVRFAPMDQFAFHRAISNRPRTPTTITILREGHRLDLSLTPQDDIARVEAVDAAGRIATPHRKVGRIGIVMGAELERAGVLEGLEIGVKQSVVAVATVVISFKAMLARKISAEPAGPIGIMAMSAETAKMGWASVLGLCALISANLAVVNMVPIPPFDGYMVLQVGVEGALRRRIGRRLELLVRLAGVVVVLCLFLWLTLNDTLNLVKYGSY